jgi:XTP/dITP diphosphohydrolase
MPSKRLLAGWHSDVDAGLCVKLVLATRNPHKLREFRGLLLPHQLDALPEWVQLPPETGSTFEQNAMEKAKSACLETGLASVGDDSGIQAQALGGEPGILSARYAGAQASDRQNLEKLLDALRCQTDRRVAYVCALAYASPHGYERWFIGRCEGVLIDTPRGGGGFGYDPAFVPADYQDGRTMAELTPEEKDAISHRGRAAKSLLAWLAEVKT